MNVASLCPVSLRAAVRPRGLGSAMLAAIPCVLWISGCQTGSPRASAPAGTVERVEAAPYAVVDGEHVPVPDIRMGDPRTIRRILEEGKFNNKVMDQLHHLAVDVGPRLTGSSRNYQSRLWVAEQFKSWGMSNVRLEKWGTIPVRFDRGPAYGKIYLKTQKRNEDGSKSPAEDIMLREMELTTLSWSAGTGGPVRGPVLKMPKDEAEYAAMKEKLKGAWILMDRPEREGMRGLRWQLGEDYRRRAEAREKIASGAKKVEEFPVLERMAFDGVAGYITASRDERVWTGAIPNWRELDLSKLPPDVHVQVRMSDYDCLNSRLADGESVEVEINLENKFTPGPIDCYMVIGEIPGTERPDEVVILSAHMDSWDGPGSQGCTDNGTGSAGMIEAARLLMTAEARPQRTIRVILWDGEEQGLLSSAEYVKGLKDRGELDKVSACFVDDGGTNYESGVPAVKSQVQLLAAATAPVNGHFYDTVDHKTLEVNVRTVDTLGTGGGSDHASFNRVGVPGFYWDESKGRADYGHGWHTQFDRIDLAIPEYLMQSSTCSAITAYNLACAPCLMPREVKEETPASK